VNSLPTFMQHVQWLSARRPELAAQMSRLAAQGVDGLHLFSALDEDRLRRLLSRLLDPAEFLSDFGIRSVSRVHLAHPYRLRVGAVEYSVAYEPAESTTRMFGGNSNWRGPIWMPINVLVIRALEVLGTYYGDGFTVEYPTGSGNPRPLGAIARELADRLVKIF